MPKPLKLTLKIAFAVLLALSLFGHAAMLFVEENAFLYYFPQTLTGIFYVIAIAAAFLGKWFFILLASATVLLFLFFYLPLILGDRISSLLIKASSYLIFAVALTVDAFILLKIGSKGEPFLVPALTDLLTLILASVSFFFDLYASGKTGKKAGRRNKR